MRFHGLYIGEDRRQQERERESRKNSEECKGGRLSTLQDKWNTSRSITLTEPSIETHVYAYWQAPAMVRSGAASEPNTTSGHTECNLHIGSTRFMMKVLADIDTSCSRIARAIPVHLKPGPSACSEESNVIIIQIEWHEVQHLRTDVFIKVNGTKCAPTHVCIDSLLLKAWTQL